MTAAATANIRGDREEAQGTSNQSLGWQSDPAVLLEE